jgi:hypothetical protein
LLTVVCEGRKLKFAFAPGTNLRGLLGKRVNITANKVRDLAKNEGLTATASFVFKGSQNLNSATVQR